MNYTNYEGCLDTASYLIECGCGDDDDKAFFLLEACRWGNIKYVKELVEKYKISPLSKLVLCHIIPWCTATARGRVPEHEGQYCSQVQI